MRQPAYAAGFTSLLPMSLATAPAVFSPGVECWQAHNPSAAAMKRTLAKFTDFMDLIQSAGA